MILSNLFQEGKEFELLPKAIQKALHYLRTTNFSEMKDGTYEIDGKKMFVILQSYTTANPENIKAESHKKYIDIQYIIEGNEIIRVAFPHKSNVFTDEGYQEEKDKWNYKELANEIDIPMYSGTFVILFPTDIHRPGCIWHKISNVRKAVVKIAIDLL
ncbi:MAG: YhcH/YjgK/YiaL family protein [Cytophagales bacterium]|nr:YhcH/YjgK/YiaL family protein [Cytophagales bacterium]MDW8384802.1 YhcH/YjgK/YiaL family protein [Flammeovirgaceae bacterium]